MLVFLSAKMSGLSKCMDRIGFAERSYHLTYDHNNSSFQATKLNYQFFLCICIFIYTMYRTNYAAFLQLLVLRSIPNNVARAILDLDPRRLVKDNQRLSRSRGISAPLLDAIEERCKVTVRPESQFASGRVTTVSSIGQSVA